ncbi:MAG TPA: hypothetical protein VFI81_03800 [Rhodanobacteraceae bacterium]|nr:hypothetical protein [Rhodanobacteraceae bacterium]
MKQLLLVFVVLLMAGCAGTPISSAPVGHVPNEPMFQFQGTWQGKLDGYDAPNFIDSAKYPITFRIVIGQDNDARVFTLEKGVWDEIKPGFFHVFWAGGPQVIITSITSGGDKDGTWVEGSTFTLVRDDADTLIAYWLRTVNNLDTSKDAKYHYFAWGYSGPMHRLRDNGQRMSCEGGKYVASRHCKLLDHSAQPSLGRG